MDGSNDELETTPIYGFGEFLLNPKERRLAFRGSFLDIKPKAFEILSFLVSKAGEVVAKDLVLDAVWEGNFVEEGNLAVHVSKLRKMFDRTGPFNYIQTLPGVGYSFVEPVKKVEEGEWKEAVKDAMPLIDPFAVEDGRESIAIMPLFNENADPELDYLADGLTEALINNLSCRPNLRVIARNTVFRFKNQDIDVKEMGRLLNVTSILTGRIRIKDDDISLSVELSSVSDGTQLWGSRFDRDFSGIFDMQDSITNSICEQLNAELGRSALDPAGNFRTSNSESYRLFLKAKFFLNKRTLASLIRAQSLLIESTSLDPLNVGSYVESANCLLWQYFYGEISEAETRKSISYLLRYIPYSSSIPEMYLLKGCISMYLDWDVKAAETHFKTAISLNPSFAQARYFFANLLVNTRRYDESLKQLESIMVLDPVSSLNNRNAAKIFYKMERFDNALSCLNEALDLEPDNYEALLLKGAVLAEISAFAEALSNLEQAREIHDHPEAQSMIAYVAALKGDRQRALEIRSFLESKLHEESVADTYLGIIEIALGNLEEAFRHLQNAANAKYPDTFSALVDPRWKRLRETVDFVAFEKNLLKFKE